MTVLVLVCSAASARDWRDGLEGTFGDPSAEMNYRYYLPADYDTSVEYPLVLFLHGSGESGTDNDRQVSQHIQGIIDKTESDYPAVFLAPQLPRSTGWSPTNPDDQLTGLLPSFMNDFSIDRSRIYVTGLSMGGFGTTAYLQYYNAHHPEILEFAAAVPLSGAFIDRQDPLVASSLIDTPVWLAHGALDRVVDVEFSRDSFRALAGLAGLAVDVPIEFAEMSLRGITAVSGSTRYTEFPRHQHDIWGGIYVQDVLFDWMFAQSLTIPEPSSGMLCMVASWGLAFGTSYRRKRGMAGKHIGAG